MSLHNVEVSCGGPVPASFLLINSHVLTRRRNSKEYSVLCYLLECDDNSDCFLRFSGKMVQMIGGQKGVMLQREISHPYSVLNLVLYVVGKGVEQQCEYTQQLTISSIT